MKKTLSLLMLAVLALTMLAGCGAEKPQETTAPAEVASSPLEILETVWGLYDEEEKFPATGGEIGETLTQGPGAFSSLTEDNSYTLLIPADQLGNVTEAASLMHMMNSNTFTCGAYRLGEGVTAEAFGEAMRNAVQNNQWICGFPETLLIQSVDSSYVLVAFGHGDIMTTFKTHLTQAYPDSQTLVEEPIA